MYIFSRIVVSLLMLSFSLAACFSAGPTGENKEKALKRGAEILAECQLTKCSRLDLDRALLRDFSVLNDMPHVTALMVSYTNFRKLSSISGMSQLEELHISNTNVSDLIGLSNFPNLTLLHAAYLHKVENFAPIGSLPLLSELAIDAGPRGDVSYIENLTALQTLSFHMGTVADFTPLTKLEHLSVLSVSSSLHQDKAFLLAIPKLKMLSTVNATFTPEFIGKLEAKGVVFENVIIVC